MSKTSLRQLLKDNGLDDVDYWMTALENIGIKSVASLNSAKRSVSTFSMLSKKSRHDAEKSSLLKLLEIDDSILNETEGDGRSKEQIQNVLPQELMDELDGVKENVVDFSSFLSYLKTIKTKVKQPGCDISPENVAKQVEKAILCLQNNYYEQYENILITILLFPFQCNISDNEWQIKLKPLSAPELFTLIEILIREEEKLKNIRGNEIELLCYFIKQAMENPKLDHLFNNVLSLLKKLKPPLEQSILNLFEKFLASPSMTVEFKEWLESYLNSPVLSTFDCEQKPQNESMKVSKECLLIHTKSSIDNLFDCIGLTDYFPKKLGLQDARCIRRRILDLSLNATLPRNLHDVPFILLHKLMSYDPKCLTDLMPGFEDDNTEDTFSESDDEESANDSSNKAVVSTISDKMPDNVHPIDCLLALLMCSDDFLSQDLYSRLAKCQRAIPFLIPNPYTEDLMLPLWSMQSIIHEWKSTVEGSTTDQTHPIVSYPMPILSFMRMGSGKCISKSKLLNEVISESEQSYNHFFHQNCSGGSYKRILGAGLVDMFWYLPSGKEDIFPDAITFLNLHGDARDHPKQVEVLSTMSTMCFVVVSERNVEFDSISQSLLKACDATGGAVFLASQKQKNINNLSNSSIINLKQKTDFEIKDAVRETIKSKFSSFRNVQNIASHLTGNSLVTIDAKFKEDKPAEIVQLIANYEGTKTTMKEALLPLQGETFWRKWADLEKELHRQTSRGKQSVQEYSNKIRLEQATVRSDQVKCIDSLTPLTKEFMTELLHLEGPKQRQSRNFFLQYLKLKLNDLSRKKISSVYKKYDLKRTELASLVNDKNSAEEKSQTEQLQKKLKVLGEEIINSSIGLEHLLREIGQVYEAAETNVANKSISELPGLVAQILVDGHPLELMDGDAAHVPLKWVSAVLMKAAEILGDPQVFVVSVLGIQSTGKSTMLNTTFGVQFNVSAGRCTHGAYMQLLPLDEEIKSKTKCKYVLIVDTEGLRALELDSLKTQKHDNELATFVIGLANVTLINIYGEVPGEIDNILQTSVHAFLRMSKIKYKPSCQFVHQNASVNAKSMIGRGNFMTKLNNFTVIAAQEESCDGQYECFNDVIKFDEQTDVHYFPGLWRGDPPMAPVNQGYSTAAQQLKQSIIKSICNRTGQSDLNLSAFQQKIHDLWKALLNETFIFSFRNTFEIRAYKQIEESYSQWQWSFKEKVLKWEHEAVNLIKTEEEAVSELQERLKIELQELVQTEYKYLQKEMEDYFRGKDSDVLKDWKGYFELKLAQLATNLEEDAETKCTRLFRSKIEITKFTKDKKKAEDSAGYIKNEVINHILLIKQEQDKLQECITNKTLDQNQLTELSDRDLFSADNLVIYEESDIINSTQIRSIKDIIDRVGVRKGLEDILTGDILSSFEVQRILEMQEQDDDIERKFNEIWKKQTQHIERIVRDIDVAGIMEDTITRFDQGNKGKVQEKFQHCRLSDKKSSPSFVPVENLHYKCDERMINGWYSINGTQEVCSVKAEKVTRHILEKINSKRGEITKNVTDSIETCTEKLLVSLRNVIKSESEALKEYLTFKPEYEIEMQLIVCRHALPELEKMTKLAQEKIDPLVYLERHEKGPLYTQFRNFYLKTKAEQTIADTICAYLEEPIRKRLQQSVPLILASKMRQSEYPYFSSKMALKVKVLTDLHKEDMFVKYMAYVLDPGRCLETYLEIYINKYCDHRPKNLGPTRLHASAREELSRIFEVLVDAVNQTSQIKAIDWLTEFYSNNNFRKKIVVTQKPHEILKGCDSSHELDLENFKLKVAENMNKLKEIMQRSYIRMYSDEKKHWEELPLDHLKDLIGCTETCPFCGEPCDSQISNHERKHHVGVHRIGCVRGQCFKDTNVLTLAYCPNNIAENLLFFKEKDQPRSFQRYQEVFPRWSIPSDKSEESLYWKLFIGKFISKLAEYYNKKQPNIDKNWKNISWKKVEEDLSRIYHL